MGLDVTPSAAPQGRTAAPATFVPRKTSVWPLVAIFALLAGLAYYMTVSGRLLQSKGTPIPDSRLARANGSATNSELLNAEGSAPNSDLLRTEGSAPTSELLKVYGSPPSSKLTQVEVEKISMPPEILAYLQHVERTEAMRVKIAREQLSSLMVDLTMVKGAGASLDALKDLADPESTGEEKPSPREHVGRSAAQKREDWNRLTDSFVAVSPPAECIKLRDDYNVALRETGAMFGQVMDALEQASTSPEAALTALQEMQNTSAPRIDQFAKDADRIIREICDKYLTRKWFDVTGDVGGGGMLGGGLGL